MVFATSWKSQSGGSQRRVKVGWQCLLPSLGLGKNKEPWDFFEFFIKAPGELCLPAAQSSVGISGVHQ